MTQQLTNRLRRMTVFVLPHEEYCKAAGECACTKSRGRVERLVPNSVTLSAFATIEAHDAVLAVSDVRRAIRQGEVTATPKPESEAAAEPDETTNAEPSTEPQPEAESAPRQQKKRGRE